MVSLAVNIDHVVTVRQARRAKEPDPVHAAVLAELGGASAIWVHLRATAATCKTVTSRCCARP